MNAYTRYMLRKIAATAVPRTIAEVEDYVADPKKGLTDVAKGHRGLLDRITARSKKLFGDNSFTRWIAREHAYSADTVDDFVESLGGTPRGVVVQRDNPLSSYLKKEKAQASALVDRVRQKLSPYISEEDKQFIRDIRNKKFW